MILQLQAKVIKDQILEGAYLENDVLYDCSGGERMVFKWADQIFHEVTARLYRENFPGDIAKEELADCIFVMSELKKLLTSKKSDAESDDVAKQALGLYPGYQFEMLEIAYKYFETMSYSGRNFFQEGAMLTIRGILGLLEHLKTNYGVDHLYTINLTQDFLERFFGKLRAMGNYDPNPSPQQFLNRVQKAITEILLEVNICRNGVANL